MDKCKVIFVYLIVTLLITSSVAVIDDAYAAKKLKKNSDEIKKKPSNEIKKKSSDYLSKYIKKLK